MMQLGIRFACAAAWRKIVNIFDFFACIVALFESVGINGKKKEVLMNFYVAGHNLIHTTQSAEGRVERRVAWAEWEGV